MAQPRTRPQTSITLDPVRLSNLRAMSEATKRGVSAFIDEAVAAYLPGAIDRLVPDERARYLAAGGTIPDLADADTDT